MFLEVLSLPQCQSSKVISFSLIASFFGSQISTWHPFWTQSLIVGVPDISVWMAFGTSHSVCPKVSVSSEVFSLHVFGWEVEVVGGREDCLTSWDGSRALGSDIPSGDFQSNSLLLIPCLTLSWVVPRVFKTWALSVCLWSRVFPLWSEFPLAATG